VSNPVELRTDRPVPHCVVLSVSGEIDLVTVASLDVAIAEHVAAAPHLVLDLSEVSFFGSVGLASLIRARALADERDTRLSLVLGARVRRTMELTRTDEVFTVHPSVEEALRNG
jgi:anti-sigma B factor antagonist